MAGKAAVLIGAIMVQLILGTVYGYSIFWQPLETELWPSILTAVQSEVLPTEKLGTAADSAIVADALAAAREREHHIGILKYAFGIAYFRLPLRWW